MRRTAAVASLLAAALLAHAVTAAAGEVGAGQGNRRQQADSQTAARPGGKAAGRQGGVNAAIVGGQDTKKGRFPWIAGLRHASQMMGHFHFCGGSLVHPRVVVTAAHCVLQAGTGVFFEDGLVFPQVRLGAWETEGGEYEVRSGVWTLVHEKWDPVNFDEDIALILLDKNATKVPLKMCPAEPDPPVKDGTMVSALGWGATSENGYYADILQEVSLDMLPLKTCKKFFNDRDWETNSMLCAGNIGESKDACQGDSGGPLIVKGRTAAEDVLVGVTSWGVGCAGSMPGVYTDLAYMRKWIDRGIKILLMPNPKAAAEKWIGKNTRIKGKNEKPAIV